MLPGVVKCCQVMSKSIKCCQVLSSSAKCCQVLSLVPKCSHIKCAQEKILQMINQKWKLWLPCDLDPHLRYKVTVWNWVQLSLKTWTLWTLTGKVRSRRFYKRMKYSRLCKEVPRGYSTPLSYDSALLNNLVDLWHVSFYFEQHF